MSDNKDFIRELFVQQSFQWLILHRVVNIGVKLSYDNHCDSIRDQINGVTRAQKQEDVGELYALTYEEL